MRVPDLIEILSNSDRIGALIELESLSSLVGEEYKSYDLSFDMDNISERILSGKTCSKRKDESGFIHLLK